MQLETIAISVAEGIARLELNRPDKANAMNARLWNDLREACRWVDATPQVRVAVISGRGRVFSAGIDLAMLASLRAEIARPCEARTRERLREVILDLQDTLTAIEHCRKPVLAAIHGACIGGAVDLACACDMRYASVSASFAVKEIDLGMVADVGTLQRLPKLVPHGIARELAYTGAAFDAAFAKEIGFVNRVYESDEALARGVAAMASQIAAKSPLAIRGIKEMLLHARDHGVADGLRYAAAWNAAMLMSDDLGEAMAAQMAKRPPRFAD
jgi:enoyl-CoA hydratase/carnithine racemase